MKSGNIVGYLALLAFVEVFAILPTRGRHARLRWLILMSVSLVFLVYLFTLVDDGLPAPPGPGGGGEGVYFLMVWGARLLAASVFVVALMKARSADSRS